MSSKGQLVVPQEIREKAGFSTGDRFVGFPVSEGVLFKRVEIPDVKAEFKKLAKDVRAQFKRKKISKREVNKAIRWGRK